MSNRIRELDGLRAVAISMVLAFHLLREPVPHHHWLDYPTRIVAIGWGGVDIFFVLSGFLVGGILLDSRGRAGALRRFLVRRLLRIVPLYAVVLAAFCIIRAAMPGAWIVEGAPPLWIYATLTQDFATPLLHRDAWLLGPTWSLAVEVQTYVALGLILSFAPARTIVPTMVAGILLAWSLRAAASAFDIGLLGYFTMPARLDAACVGVLVAVMLRSQYAEAVAARASALMALSALLFTASAAIAALGQGIGSPGANYFIHAALAVASGALIAAVAAPPDGPVKRALRWPPAIKLGTISYGVYLLHKPVIGTLHAVLGRSNVLLDSVSAGFISALGVALTLAVSSASWRWFEGPLIRWGHRKTQAVRA